MAQITEVEIQGAAVNPIETQGMIKAQQKAELIQQIQSEAHNEIMSAVDKSFRYADALAKETLASIKAELAGFAKPKQLILTVNVNGVQNKLSRTAHPLLGDVLEVIKLGRRPYLHGPAGCGKTTLAAQAAEALGVRFATLALSAGTSEAWLCGRWSPEGFNVAECMNMVEHGGVFLFDEADNVDANMGVFLNNILDTNPTCQNPINGKSVKKHTNFFPIAAGNTVGLGADAQYSGRNRLDASTRDRFIFIECDYVPEIEEAVCPDEQIRKLMQNAREILRKTRAQQVISTRKIEDAYLLKQAGWALPKILKSVTTGWPVEVVKSAGLEC